MTRFYIMQLNKGNGLNSKIHYAAYRETAEGLAAVWREAVPGDAGESDAYFKAQAAKVGMAYNRRPSNGPDRYPAYTFCVKGYDSECRERVAELLSERFPGPCHVSELGGWAPSFIGVFEGGRLVSTRWEAVA